MIQNTQNEQLIKISNWISPRLDRYEIILFSILVAALLLRISTNLPTGIVITLSLMTLALMYFFSSFSGEVGQNKGAIEQFIKPLMGISGAMGTIGILYTLLNWPGSKLMLLSGCSGLMISLLIMLVLKFMNTDLKIITQRMILRIAIILAIGTALYFTPNEILIKSGLVKEVNVEKVE